MSAVICAAVAGFRFDGVDSQTSEVVFLSFQTSLFAEPTATANASANGKSWRGRGGSGPWRACGGRIPSASMSYAYSLSSHAYVTTLVGTFPANLTVSLDQAAT